MASNPPADNATRPCGKCGKPRGDSRRHICGPCWNSYQQDYNARKKIRDKERRAPPTPVIVSRVRRCGASPGADVFWLDTW